MRTRRVNRPSRRPRPSRAKVNIALILLMFALAGVVWIASQLTSVRKPLPTEAGRSEKQATLLDWSPFQAPAQPHTTESKATITMLDTDASRQKVLEDRGPANEPLEVATAPGKPEELLAPDVALSVTPELGGAAGEKPAGRSRTARPTLHHLTYATHGGSDDYFCRCLRLALIRGIPLRILGWGDAWHGLVQKWTSLSTVLKEIPDDDVIIFGDAYDVFYNATSDEILDAFLEWNLDEKVVFMGEKGCWPQITYGNDANGHGKIPDVEYKDGEDLCLNVYPESPTPSRYLNSGTWIGRKKVVVPLVQETIASIITPKDNDQEIIANNYIRGRKSITLDYRNTLFQSVHLNQKTLKLEGGRIYNPDSDTYPKIFHFNGGAKDVFKQYEGWLLNSADRKTVKGSETFLTEGEGTATMASFCSKYPYMFT